METSYRVAHAKLDNPADQQAVLAMMNAYASDPMGDGCPLSSYAHNHLIEGLRQHPTSLVFLAWDQNSQPIGIATCFRGFSTFSAKPTIQISDFFVLPSHRGLGIGSLLMKAIEVEAIASKCCKMTLEVQENNHVARSVYRRHGFHQAIYVAEAGGSLHLTKALPSS